jgi:hypothetical protein
MVFARAPDGIEYMPIPFASALVMTCADGFETGDKIHDSDENHRFIFA